MPPADEEHPLRRSLHDEPQSAPSSRVRSAPPSRLRAPIQQVIDELRELYPGELADVLRWIARVKSTRGATPDPGLVSLILAELLRLLPLYQGHGMQGVPVSRVRVAFPEVPGPELDRALLDAEARQLLRLLPVELPAAFVEPGAGVATARGLLYFIAPAR